jgi:hypothetical protein
MRKKNAIIFMLLFSALTGFGQTAGGPSIFNALVGQYCGGSSPTNNNRVPIWCWMEISGLMPGATYRYYTALDTLNSGPTSNGAGNCYLVNSISGTIRRTANVSMTSNAGYDSLVASNTGTYAGWFGMETTGNGRFVPGTTVYPKIMLNNGSGGSTVASRLIATLHPITVISFGTTASSNQGSALYDSLDATPKNFICVYDNVAATGRPISIAITEDDGMDLYAVSSIANFYANMVDTLPMHWGCIIPNDLANGVRALEERSFSTGAPVVVVTDADGWWCSGVNTVNMTGGLTAAYLNSTFSLQSSASIPDTVWVNLSANFNVTTNDPNATITWDYGDTGTGSGAMTTHTYTTPGVVSVLVVVTNGGCTDSIWHNVIVELGMTVPRQVQLGFDISPNPSSGTFFIASRSAIEKEVQVYDVLGNPVYTSTFTGANAELDLTGLQKGVYFMRVTENVQGGKTATKRIVIQ